jgi:nucleotide-binding universal stress UspA family protein
MKVLVIYDGTLQGTKALRYGLGKVREKGGELTVLHTVDPSLFIGYDAVPGALERGRSEATGQLAAAKQAVAEQAVSFPVSIISAEGNALDVARHHAELERPDLIIAPQKLKALAKDAPSPVLLVPGVILVPVDASGIAADADAVAAEASSLGASVRLAGIVPFHLYSRDEREELDRVRHDAGSAVARLKRDLASRGIAAEGSLRAGYPDEEILRAAEELDATLIMLPSGGATPSELSKAAAVLQDEPDRVKHRLILLTGQQAG